ncbi:hypothetical protein FRT60_07640 [Pseudomonas haemolytica]|uniref:DUF3509 domain-containing protein n=1 Tax=Pseudomonas haemolytica TaxID=2600065 RepID=A0A646NVS5_9PSED|nr:hypothetical protein [Pseudomonas haemolytica]MRJ20212.1 hypothetical protein [Pseudomonas haemolytica]
MDTLSKSEIEKALAERLPSYRVMCTLHADGTLSAVLSGPETDHFAITGIVRAHYHGKAAISRLATEILREMVMSRQGMKNSRLQALSDPVTCAAGPDR